jgi:hypothetical protein
MNVAKPRAAWVRVRRVALVTLIAAMVLVTLYDGIARGLHTILPGGMSRSRDSMAVAISFVRYGLWDGYASYRLVNKAMRDNGLSVHRDELAQIGVDFYFDVMLDPALLRRALDAATSLPDPAADGMFYMQDEKGLAVLYLLAFSLFGVAPESLFFLYMLLLSVALALAVLTFWARFEVLLFFLVYACMHYATMLILPEMPRQDINVIQGSRYLGILASVPMFHVMFLLLYRIRPTLLTVSAALGQVLVLVLMVNARTSVYWTLLAIGLLSVIVLLHLLVNARWQSLRRTRAKATGRRWQLVWPLALVVLGVSGLWFHQQYGLNAYFRTPEGQQGRVFWHNVTTALANHPDRSAYLGIPSDTLAYDDQVGYYLFDREIERRGARREEYVVADRDWGYRTTEPRLDFRWGAYDLILRDVVVRIARTEPLFVAESLLVHQPASAARLIVSPGLLRWEYILATPILAALLLGSVLAAIGSLAAIWRLALAWGVGFTMALGPLIVAAVVELRVVEVFFLTLFGGALAVCLVISGLCSMLVGVTVRRATTPNQPLSR